MPEEELKAVEYEKDEEDVEVRDQMGYTRKKEIKELSAKKKRSQDANDVMTRKTFYEKFFMTWKKDEDQIGKDPKLKLHEDGGNFNEEEIELIACALKNELKEARNGLRHLDILMKKPKFEELQGYVEMYQTGMRRDFDTICKRQLHLLDEFLKVSITTSELILFTKLKADIHRYLSENGSKDRMLSRQSAKEEYERAVAYCQMERERLENFEQTEAISPVKLGVYLNQAVFLYDVEHEKKQALRQLKAQIREALDAFDKWSNENFEQIKHQVELIQENILIWKEEVDTESDEEN